LGLGAHDGTLPMAASQTARRPTSTTPAVTTSATRDRMIGSPVSMARSLRDQVRYEAAADQMPRTTSGSPTTRRPPANPKGGSSWLIARPAVVRASDVRIHASSVRSFAYDSAG